MLRIAVRPSSAPEVAHTDPAQLNRMLMPGALRSRRHTVPESRPRIAANVTTKYDCSTAAGKPRLGASTFRLSDAQLVRGPRARHLPDRQSRYRARDQWLRSGRLFHRR